MLLIRGGLVKTCAGADIENGQVLVDGGKIVAVGAHVDAPADAEVIDATGMLVTPGLVEGHCHVGMHEEVIGPMGDDVNEDVDPVTPQLRAIDAINPMDEAFQNAREHGVTCIVTGPGSANVVGGTFCAIKTQGHRVDDMLVKKDVAMKVAFGENPKRVYGGQKKSPSTRMGTAALLRETLFKAREYERAWSAYEADNTLARPAFDMRMEAMRPVIRGELPLKAHAHRADDLFTALRIFREFGVKFTLDHVTDGSLIADDLAREGCSALVGPTFGNKTKPEVVHKSFETPGVLTKAGVEVGIITDAPVIPIHFLSMCAGLAVNAGLSEDDGWRSVTINNARITGIANRVGSLEVGKDADIAIFRGNPLRDLDYETVLTLIDGKIAYRR